MIISWIRDGLGNQMFRYAAGRRLALKRNAEFKICIAWYDKYPEPDPYQLNQFNIYEKFATLEEVEEIKKLKTHDQMGQAPLNADFVEETLDYPDNVVLFGSRENERYFLDVSDVIRKDFTLKRISDATRRLEKKILEDKYTTVSIHFRRNFIPVYDDRFSYSSRISNSEEFHMLCTLNYYYYCISELEKLYNSLSFYVFSDDIDWVKKNFKTNHQLCYVTGMVPTDVEEMHLMSQCNHHIIANSTFSWWGAWLGKNPQKKVFAPKQFFKSKEDAVDIVPETWIKVDNLM